FVSSRLEGKVGLITGGASGIGAATAKLFLKHGAKVIVADVQDDLGHSLCQELGSEEIITYAHCDVTCESDVRNAVDLAVSKYGKLDIMHSNAGLLSNVVGILDTDNEEFRRAFDVNVFGGFLAAKHAARVMIPAKKGSIIFNASNVSMTYLKAAHAYVSSKNAVVGLAKNLCVELGQYGIRVNCVSPYGIVTPLLKFGFGLMGKENEKIQEEIEASGNLKQVVLEAENVAEAALYLGSDESKYVSGLNLVVDGGYSLTNPAIEMAMKRLHSS
ncbi:secoisolariciresinol dehydrogenase, partial [Manihot esculenta]|uniref:secoisolariciresinol dehydrogenase n=1 Tax=Manihot esculenta TaxID=3983 RepID=UPI001CC6EE5D